MKGIEGMALRYILIILIAALVIGTVYTVMSTFTGMVASSGSGLNSTLDAGLNRNNQLACESFGGCTWNSENQTCACT